MFFWRDRRELPSGRLERCFTDSLGGVSEAPFSGLNLGAHVGDNPQHVATNRGLLTEQFGVEGIAWLDQVHGKEVAVVTAETLGEVPCADAQVTVASDVPLAVMVADCTPVLLSAPREGVLGVAHAGRPGMLAGVVPAAVEAMKDLGATDIEAVVGPSVCGRCYEVPEKMRREAGAIEPESRAVTWHGTPAIDVASGVVAQLARMNVHVTWVAGCTVETPSLYSYRRDGQTGRFAGIIVRREGEGGEAS